MDDQPPAEPPTEPATEPSPEPSADGSTVGSTARTAGLLATAFLGTLVVLLGLLLGFRGIAGSAASSTPSSSESAAMASASSGPPASPTPVATASPSSAAPSGSSAPGPSPTRGPSPSGDPVLVGAGDIASCGLDGDEATARQVDGIAGTVFTAGDNAYEAGSADDFKNCYDPTWGRFKDRTRPAAGNHDWLTPDAQGYRDYFGAAAVNADGKTWYSYDLGEWHIVVLDANCGQVGGCGADSDQGRWLAADLAANQSVCTMAIWHQPRFSSGDEHGNDPEVDPFWRALYAAGADVVVNGHDHDYERFGPQDPAGHPDAARGIREFVVGTGGAAIRGFNPPVANSELRLAIGPGVIKFTLHPRSYDWTWFSATTDVTDSGGAPCH
jgi:Calcineurin-like phosphoesterase